MEIDALAIWGVRNILFVLDAGPLFVTFSRLYFIFIYFLLHFLLWLIDIVVFNISEFDIKDFDVYSLVGFHSLFCAIACVESVKKYGIEKS